VAFAASAGDARAIAAAATAIGAYVFLQAARLAFRRARGFDGMGGGDPGVMAALGAWLGPLGAPWALAVASVLGLAMVLAIPRLRHKRARLAFSPFLVVGAAVVAIVQAAFGADPFWSLGVAP
jgi:leader peptidase (prepilin peptidase)/N-methyltransferase